MAYEVIPTSMKVGSSSSIYSKSPNFGSLLNWNLNLDTFASSSSCSTGKLGAFSLDDTTTWITNFHQKMNLQIFTTDLNNFLHSRHDLSGRTRIRQRSLDTYVPGSKLLILGIAIPPLPYSCVDDHPLAQETNGSLDPSTYCWWLKSCTTWDVWNPKNNGIKYQPQLVSLPDWTAINSMTPPPPCSFSQLAGGFNPIWKILVKLDHFPR